jgi:hypothetical protein
VVIAHNLLKWDGERLKDRLVRDYKLNAHIIYHRNYHDEIKAPECELCQMLFEDIVGNASSKAAGVAGVVTP